MPTTLTNGIQLPDKGSVDWYNSMQSNYNLIDTHLGNTDTHVTAEDKANWNSKQGSLSQAQLDAIAQVATNTNDIATLQSGKANASHTHSSSDITDIDDYATKQYVDNSISGLVDNAPDALNTLNELSAALNDDSNFASTVTTALGAKANSADLATVATSGDYDDLSNKPSIPINTSDLNNDSGFVTLNDFDIPAKTSDLTNDSGFITSSDVPTGTSDLINDSNFVDISNSAVASGITSAKVTSYDSHVADTDIHVTTADKTKWNNQTYVFRYSSTALVASSTNSNTLLDNTDNLKVGDKVIDSSGVLFSITAIDTANSTFTIGTALIDLAQDSDVVHKSGDETVGGTKTFDSNTYIYNSDNTATTPVLILKNSKVSKGSSSETGTQMVRFYDKGDALVGELENVVGNKQSALRYRVSTLDSNNQPISIYVTLIVSSTGSKLFCPGEDNGISLGGSTLRWSKIYGTEYYYGSNNVEFSTKFVTTDTNQTISGNKTFSSNVNVYNSDSSTDTANIILKNSKAERGSTTNIGEQTIFFLDKNNAQIGHIKCDVDSNGYSNLTLQCSDTNDTSSGVQVRKTSTGITFQPISNSQCYLGQSIRRWYSTYTSKINGVEPSSLSLPNIDNRIDISSYITNLSNVGNEYTPSVNGWICIRSGNATKISVLDVATSVGNASISSTATYLTVMTPVVANRKVYITVICTSLEYAYFIPCQGNV